MGGRNMINLILEAREWMEILAEAEAKQAIRKQEFAKASQNIDRQLGGVEGKKLTGKLQSKVFRLRADKTRLRELNDKNAAKLESIRAEALRCTMCPLCTCKVNQEISEGYCVAYGEKTGIIVECTRTGKMWRVKMDDTGEIVRVSPENLRKFCYVCRGDGEWMTLPKPLS